MRKWRLRTVDWVVTRRLRGKGAIPSDRVTGTEVKLMKSC